MSAIEFAGVQMRYGATEALKSLDLRIEAGEFVTLLGPSGSGKTTALRCLAGLESPTGGRIELDGRTVSDPAAGVEVPPERRGVGFVFQNYALWPHMTVRGNVEYPLKRRGRPRDERQQRVEELLGTVGLEGVGHHRASDLSGGQQQRVALARALANDSRFMLFDEPLSNLDAQLRVRTRLAIRRIHDELGTTTVFVTHDQDEAFTISDRVVVMNYGEVEQDGGPEHIYDQPATAFVARFVGYDNVVEGARVTRVDPAGRAEVDLPDRLGTCEGRAGHAREGDVVTVAFRAGDVLLGEAASATAGGSGTATTTASVASVSFATGSWSVVLDCGGQRWTARVPGETGRPALAVGDQVPVCTRPGRPVLLPAHGG